MRPPSVSSMASSGSTIVGSPRTSVEEPRPKHEIHQGKNDEDEEKATGIASTEAPPDPNVVDFPPGDPENPLNWTNGRKWLMILGLSLVTFVSPLASSMFAPAVPDVQAQFHNTDGVLGSFVVSVFVLGYASGPVVIAPLSEIYGRLPVYNITNVLFFIFTLACALSPTYNALFAFRFLAGFVGSAPLTLGGGTIADLFKQEERGAALSIWSTGALVAPVLGPILGGVIADHLEWEWIFWVLAIAAGVSSVFFFIFVRETNGPVLLKRRAKKLRAETGNQNLRAKGDTGETSKQVLKRSIIKPLKMLFLSPIVFLTCLYTAVSYGYLYLLFTTITDVFTGTYHFSQAVVGLTYLGVGVGLFIGLGVVGGLSDRLIKKKAAGGEMKPEYRLPFMIPGALFMPIGLLIYGWTAYEHIFWFVPIFGTVFVGIGIMGVFLAINAYLVDAFPQHAASSLAANTILRSTFGALLPLAGPPLYSALGYGWGNSVLAFIAISLLGVPFIILKYGETWRTDPRFKLNL